MRKVLLCGQRSYASYGLREMLQNNNEIDLYCFSRGEIEEKGNEISGDVFNMSNNPYLRKGIEIVINYILLKDCDTEKNLNYLQSLVKYCEQEGVKRIIHISSVSVYANNLSYVNENTDYEHDNNRKGRYSALKIMCDEYLENLENESFKVSFIRPGYIVEDHYSSKLNYIMIPLIMNYGLLLGDKQSSLPLINRKKMNDAIMKIILSNNYEKVYLLLENKKGTKYQYAKDACNRNIICLPKHLTMCIATILRFLHIFSDNKYEQVKGLFKNTYFDSSHTQELLNIKF